MLKKPEKRSDFTIPLPNTIRDALLHPKKDDSHMSHTVKVGREKEVAEKDSELTSDNHAFYIGKFIPFSFGEKVAKVMGWGDVNSRLYTREFIEACLDYQFRHLAEGEKAKIMIGRSLSELFNGPEDTVNALSLEKQRDLIFKIAWKKFKKDSDDLEVVEFEEVPEHKPLFSLLRENVDKETGVVKLSEAMDGLDISRLEGDSLIFAKYLYDAYTNDERFKGAIDGTVPAQLKDSEQGSVAYYGLVEIAIRLADIKSGRTIHGGADRQEKYDRIIERIIKGKKGGYKYIEALAPIFESVKGCSFETLHLKTEENPREITKTRNIARTRLGILFLLSAAAIYGAYEFGRHTEQEDQEKRETAIKEILLDELGGEYFYMGGDPKFHLDKKHNPDAFIDVVDDAMKDVQQRYRLSSEEIDEIRPVFMQYLLANKNRVSTMYGGNGFLRTHYVDLFMQKYKIYLKGISIDFEKPYSELYKFLPVFEELLDSDEDIIVNDAKEMEKKKDFSMTSGLNQRFKHIGTFYSAQQEWRGNKYEFYFYTDDEGKKHIVAKDKMKTKTYSEPIAMASWDVEVEYYEYSAQKAKEGIRQFIYSIKRYDALELKQYDSMINDMNFHIKHDADGEDLCENESESRSYVSMYGDIGLYKDTFGRFEFEFGMSDAYDKDSKDTRRCLVARRPGEEKFTYKTAKEMVKYYNDVNEAWYNYHQGEYIESDFLPPDFTKINQKIQEVVCILDQIKADFEDGTPEDVQKEIEDIERAYKYLEKCMDEYDGSYKAGDSVYSAHKMLKDDIRSLEWILERDYGYKEGDLQFPKELTE